MYKPVVTQVNFPKLEEAILEFWEKNDILRKSITRHEGCEEFVFYDGPHTRALRTPQSYSAVGRRTCPKMLVVRMA